VDPTTESQVLARIAAPPGSAGSKPLVFRTSFTMTQGSAKPGTPTAALMVVIPTSSGGGTRVDFVDPTTYRELESVDTP
jgi:hypothetical protein